MAVNWIDGVLRNSTHGGNQLLTLIVLAESANRDTGDTWLSIATISALTRSSERTVQRSLTDLEQSGEISRTERKATHQTTIYRLNPRLLRTTPPRRQIDACQATDWHPPGDTVVTTQATPVSPEPLIEPLKENVYINAQEGENFAPPQMHTPAHPYEPTGIVDRQPIWRAYLAGAGIDQRHPSYLAIEAKNRVGIERLTWATPTIDLEQFEAATRYLITRWRAGNIYAIPTIDQVFAALPEFEAWVADGSPTLERDAAPPESNHNGNGRPANIEDYWQDRGGGSGTDDYAEADRIFAEAQEKRRQRAAAIAAEDGA